MWALGGPCLQQLLQADKRREKKAKPTFLFTVFLCRGKIGVVQGRRSEIAGTVRGSSYPTMPLRKRLRLDLWGSWVRRQVRCEVGFDGTRDVAIALPG